MLWDPIRYAETCPSSRRRLRDGARQRGGGRRGRGRRSPPAWVQGTAMRSEPTHVGRPRHGAAARRRATAPPTCTRRPASPTRASEIDCVEMYVPFSLVRADVAREPRLRRARARAGRWSRTAPPRSTATCPVNMSGGVLSSNPIGASGMLRFAEAAMQVRGHGRRAPGRRRPQGAWATPTAAARSSSPCGSSGPTSREWPAASTARSPSSPAAARGQGEAEARRVRGRGGQGRASPTSSTTEGEAVAAVVGDAAALRAPRRQLRGGSGWPRWPTPRSASARSACWSTTPASSAFASIKHQDVERLPHGSSTSTSSATFLGMKTVAPSMTQGRRRLDHQHLVQRRDLGPALAGRLLGQQVGHPGPVQDGRHRARPGRHPRELGPPRRRRHAR